MCSTSLIDPLARYAGMEAARAMDGVSTESAALPPASWMNLRRSTSGMRHSNVGNREIERGEDQILANRP